MPAADVLDKINSGVFGSTVTNFAAVRKSGETPADAAGEKNFTSPDAEKTSGATMFGEGSIGKVRFAGLAFMMQEEGTIDLQKNAGEFFSSPEATSFLEKKYGEKAEATKKEIAKLFSGDAAKATLADLTTHRSGIGDLTRDQLRLTAEKGIEHQFSIPELLLIPEAHRGIPRDEGGRPRAQSAGATADADLPLAKHGEHQYSNLGYMLLGLAMETAYDAKKNPRGENEIKDYKQLTRDYMLHPIEGPAKEKDLSFDQTKFPEELEGCDVARSPWLEKGNLIDPTKISAANAAGGIFVSADDSAKFFNEFFKGFPGTPTAGVTNANPFFSDDTIAVMMAEGLKFGECGVNHNPQTPARDGNERFQCPGFVSEIDRVSGEPIAFEKGGGTCGYASFLAFDVKSSQAMIDMCAQENVTGEIAKNLGVETKDVVEKYRDPKSGKFDRRAMIAVEMPEIAAGKTGAEEVKEAMAELACALRGNGATAADTDADPEKVAAVVRKPGGRGH
jgi:CubicO group peptidase (beta-lactamase class C family)